MYRKMVLKIWVLWIEAASAVQLSISENAIHGRQWPASLALFAGPPALVGTSNKKSSRAIQNPWKDNTEQ